MKNPIPARLFSMNGMTYSVVRYDNKIVVTEKEKNTSFTREFPTHAAARKAMNNPGSLF